MVKKNILIHRGDGSTWKFVPEVHGTDDRVLRKVLKADLSSWEGKSTCFALREIEAGMLIQINNRLYRLGIGLIPTYLCQAGEDPYNT